MASYRKKYASLEETEPVTTPPVETAKLPPETETPPKLEEPPKESNKVEEAAQSAIKQRLSEMENAAAMQSAPPQQPPQAEDPDEEARMRRLVHALEEAVAPLPNENAKTWFRLNPQFIFDEEQRERANHFHYIVQKEVGSVFTPEYFAGMERKLGMCQPEPPPAPKNNGELPRASSGPSVNYSAPPSRESPSMSTGRSPTGPTKLTAEELDLARTLKLTPDEYRAGKERMLREKGDGYHSDGR